MSAAEPAGGPLAIVAGGGGLPWEAAALVAPRRRVVVFAVDGEADGGFSDIETHRIGFGEVGRAFKMMRERGCHDILFLGAIRTRPDYRRVLGDVETWRLLPKIVRAIVGGDDTVMRNVLAIIETEGFRIVSVADAVPELLAPPGRFGRHDPDGAHEADIALGTAFLDAAAPFDVGQAVAVTDGRIVAVEGAEGTDAMIARCGDLLASPRVRARRRSAVLVKRAKRTQDMRSDVPVVGARTLDGLVRAGFGGLAIEAGRTIVAERTATVAASDRAGVFIVAR